MAKSVKRRGGKINVESLAQAVMDELGDYDEYISGTVLRDAILETAEQTAEIVAQAAPVDKGDYQRSITYGQKLVRGRSDKVTYTTVYAESPEYSLTHLLEKPHALVNGGRSTPTEHWGKGEKDLSDRFVNNFKSRL